MVLETETTLTTEIEMEEMETVSHRDYFKFADFQLFLRT